MNKGRGSDGSPTVLVVDDSPDDLLALTTILKGQCATRVAASGDRALALARETHPDLILLDAAMPEMSGYDVCEALQSDEATRGTPVLFIADRKEPFDEQRAFALGAVDYMTKPVSRGVLLNRVRTHLRLKRASEQLVDHQAELDSEVTRQLQEIQKLQDGLIVALATLAEARDDETANHLRRVQHYVRATALRLRESCPRLAAELAPRHIDIIFRAVPLHDIGKVGVPDRVLLQPGPYSREEFEESMRHTTIGAEALASAEKTLSYPNPFLTVARQIAQDHHERWDGTGYPRGLRGEEIPLAARLMAIADTYDALVTRRFYRNPVGHEKALEIILEGRGTQFDPDVTDAFIAEAGTMRRIAQRYADSDVAVAEKLLAMERELTRHTS